jgi:hypothetical protein
MRNIVVILPFFFFISSCVVIGLTSDYGKLDNDQKQMIVPLNSFDEVRKGNIYKVNATQLIEGLSKHPKSIVYVFTAGCCSASCLQISTIEKFAKENAYHLFPVLTGYSELNKVLEQNFESPLFSIDDKYYKTRYRHIYERYFTNELMNLPAKTKYSERENSGWIFIYNYGQLTNVFKELPEGDVIKN